MKFYFLTWHDRFSANMIQHERVLRIPMTRMFWVYPAMVTISQQRRLGGGCCWFWCGTPRCRGHEVKKRLNRCRENLILKVDSDGPFKHPKWKQQTIYFDPRWPWWEDMSMVVWSPPRPWPAWLGPLVATRLWWTTRRSAGTAWPLWVLRMPRGFPSKESLDHGSPTWRAIPVSKYLVTTIYKPFRPFTIRPTLLRDLLTMFINHLLTGMIFQVGSWNIEEVCR